MEGIQLPAALALLLALDLGGARQREGKNRFNVVPAGDLAADVTDQPAKARSCGAGCSRSLELHFTHGTLQACSPSQGVSGWFSHTQPQSSQRAHQERPETLARRSLRRR
jgi:hypothetical protein